MADFKTHITVSTTLGVAYGAVAYKQFGLPAPTCLLAGTLCSVSGMLPDLDSDSGVPLRESLAFAAACVPLLLFERLRAMGWSNEVLVLAGAGIYFGVRFGIGNLLKKYTVHRGMFHSLPAAVIAGEIAFLLCVTGDVYLRAYKACAVVTGFLSHLILDEIYSVKVQGGRIGLKSSSGTALKLWGSEWWPNISCYGKLVFFGFLVLKDPVWATVSPEAKELHRIASSVVDQVEQHANNALPGSLPSPGGTASWFAAPSFTPPPTYTSPTPSPSYVPPTYAPPPTYAVPPNYAAPVPLPPLRVAPPQTYGVPQSQQAQWPAPTPYVSPRY
jgi:hypothetical protein